MELRWILLLPILGAVLNGLIVRSKSAVLSGIIGTLAALGAFAVSVIALLGLREVEGSLLTDAWFTWFETGRVSVDFLLEVTPITGVMLVVITGIGSLIHLYSIGYMSHDKAPWRFFSYLNLFLASMLTLILSGNLVGVFLGWEGVGLCSYLLIGFWYQEEKNAAAGMKAFVTNRVGDLGFLLALFVLLAFTGTTEIRELITLFNDPNHAAPSWVLVAVAGGLLWASTGKSAQIPLYVWLPDAMAGPTPVSALIHAATMVTSGIFVTVRLWPLFAEQAMVLDFMMWGGLATAWLAALIALTQRDIKKVLAYSTVSQLGFMFVALGCGSPEAALFHVVTHACFKALLFLGAGSVIHGVHEQQDMFLMGGLRKKMPWTHFLFLIATLAIIGFPLTSGFFSKDLIIAKAFEKGIIPFVLLVGAALLTAFYMLRAYTLTFWGEARSKEASHAHESSWLMVLPLFVLGILSLFVGWLETPEIIGDHHSFSTWVRSSWYGAEVQSEAHHLSHSLEWGLVIGVTLASLTVAYWAFKKFGRGPGAVPASRELGLFARLSQNKFYVDELYQSCVINPLSGTANFVNSFVEGRGINGVSRFLSASVRVSGQLLSFLHVGHVQTYAWYLATGTGLAILVAWVVLR